MNETAKQELELIRNENNGFLRPQDVVEYARDEQSALHGFFEWDNNEAAEKYRIAQARALIRVCVVVEQNTSQKTRVYVSLSSDRIKGDGYRTMVQVVNDEVMRETLLADALKEIAMFQRKYNILKEVAALGNLFTAIDSVVSQTNVKHIEEQRVSA